MQHDDPNHAANDAITKTHSVDLNSVQDNINQLAEKSGKIKGINKSRIDTDMAENDIIDLFESTYASMSREASVELLKFIKFKVMSGQFSKNYHRVYRSLFGDTPLSNLINGKLSDDERFEILAKCVNRLIQKRPLVFYGTDDTAVFRDGSSNTDNNDFVTAASNPARLADYISYSEMEFSRRITLSTLTHLYKFTGTGYNKISSQPILIHAHAGIRLDRQEVPEYKKLIFSETKNVEIFKSIKMSGLLGGLKKPDVGAICTGSTPQQEFMLLQEKPHVFIDIGAYKSMIREIIDNYLADCNHAGALTKKEVYVRLMPIDLFDSNYSIAGQSDSEKQAVSFLIQAQRDALKSVIDQEEFTKKYPHITMIELRHAYWSNTKSDYQNPLVTYKKFASEDLLAELTESMNGTNDKGSTNDTILCINMVCSANAYTGNRIYKNSLSSIEAEFANRSNITTLLNPLFNPLLTSTALQEHLLIRFPSGRLSSTIEIKQALIKAAQTATSATTIHSEETQSAAEPDRQREPSSTSAKSTFNVFGNLFVKMKLYFTKAASFFKLIADIFRHIVATVVEMINARRKR